MPPLRWLAPAAVLALAGVGLAAEPPTREILLSLFRNIPADDFDYDAGARLSELEERLNALHAAADAASCPRDCEARSALLENGCAVMLQPAAARSRAVCLARVIEIGAQCRAGCGR